MEKRPIQILLGTSKPFFLDKNDSFWVVASGNVEIYLVKRDKKGNLCSARNYLYTARKGDILFSLRSEIGFNEFSLIAVSSESKLIEVHKSVIGNLNKSQLSSKIDRWINSLSSRISTGTSPKIFLDINNSGDFKLKKNQISFPSKGLFWADVVKGSISFCEGKEEINSDTYNKNVLLPVSKELWLQALEKDTQLKLYKTSTIVNDDITLMLSIHSIQDYFYKELIKIFNSKSHIESSAINNKTKSDSDAILNSLSGLKSIVFSKKADEVFLDVNTSNPLFGACQLIGKETGFEFVEPKFVRDFEQNLTGQLNAIVQVSNVRARKVILRGRWWEEENGHLLAFTRDDKEPVALIQGQGGKYTIKNPATNKNELVTEEIAQRLEPISYMFLYAFDEPMSSIKKIGKFAIKGLKVDAGYILLVSFFRSKTSYFSTTNSIEYL